MNQDEFPTGPTDDASAAPDSLSRRGGGRADIDVDLQVDSVCDAFESAWQAGKRPELSDFLVDTQIPGSTLFVELVQIDMDYRRRTGERISIEEYAVRYPEFSDILSRLGSAIETASIPAARERPAQVLGRFELVAPLGEGTFGVVWKARDTKLRTWVAIKRFRESILLQNRELFAREARALQKLHHPNVVQLRELSQGVLTDYIVFEFVDGRNLKAILDGRKGTPLEPERAAKIARQLAEGLQHVHEHGIIHRDFKPANVMLMPDETAKILDFGLARHTDSASTIAGKEGLLGTVPYMSPEQCSGEPVTAATDVYSLGAVLYEMLAGRRPFEGSTTDLVARIGKGNPPPFNAPPALQTIVRRAMEVDPRDRYASAAEMAADLTRFFEQKPLPRRWRPGRQLAKAVGNRRDFLAAGVGMLATGAATWAFVNRSPPLDDGKVTVKLTTDPPGARLSFIPLDRANGRPQAEFIEHAPTLSPVTIRLAPRDYLVVATLGDTMERFHEVYRHVPANAEKAKQPWRHTLCREDNEGAILLMDIRIPEASVTNSMVLVEGAQEFNWAWWKDAEQRMTIPDFWVDPFEFTVAEYRRIQERGLRPSEAKRQTDNRSQNKPDDFAMGWMSFDEALQRAEDSGKRLLHEWEHDYLSSNQGTTRYPWGNTPFDQMEFPPALGQIGDVPFDKVHTKRGDIHGLCSNVDEWVDSYHLLWPEIWSAHGAPQKGEMSLRHLRGNLPLLRAPESVSSNSPRDEQLHYPLRQLRWRYDMSETLGFRCARSVRPRLLPSDFVREIRPAANR